MLFYALYQAGYRLCAFLPRRLCHAVACGAADVYSAFSSQDLRLVRVNLAAVTGVREEEVSPTMVREVFRNFAMYLVDFFRFSRLRDGEVSRVMRLEGLEWMKEALSSGKGAIAVTAHLGNYELGAAVLSLSGFPVSAVVLTHQNKRVDAFFERQRARVGVQGIPVQRMQGREFLETCLSALRAGRVLGLVADRDYFDHGIEMSLFGHTVRLPTGPASFSLRTGAPIVPCFVVRERDGKYRFVMEPPIRAPEGAGREEALRRMTQQCLDVMAKYVRFYPTQWYMFQEFWRSGPAFIR
ncbi:MAG: lysophospholipid acyltransferase family protein [Candidatus Omnitrophica bacterium]|nr:lysophospholipid acyltransferase family protein [Candidatus Omnitrophota bacterium]